MLFTVVTVFENEGLLLPSVRMPSSEQNLEGLDLVLRFRVS